VTDTESEITADLIAQLLREQHPDLADLPVTFGAHGWDNQLWLHGDLHPANLLTGDGNFCGVVDFGDMCAGIRPVTWRPAGYFCPTGSSTVSTGATRRLLTQRPGAALAAGR
jgi:Phosphotransferase enzyme family